MISRSARSRAVLAVAWAGLAWSGAPAQALQIENGDIVGVFVKNGVEVIVNLGPFEPGSVSLAGKFSPPEFGGSPADAKFVALAVEDPGRTVSCCGGNTLPQENIIYSSLDPNAMPTDLEIELAMRSVDEANPGATVWFNLLRALPGTDSDVVQSSDNFSYENVLGKGTDKIGNNFQGVTTAGIIDGAGQLSINLFSDVRGYEDFGGPPTLYQTLGQIEIDGSEVTFVVPEPAQALATAVGSLVLGSLARLRRRATTA